MELPTGDPIAARFTPPFGIAISCDARPRRFLQRGAASANNIRHCRCVWVLPAPASMRGTLPSLACPTRKDSPAPHPPLSSHGVHTRERTRMHAQSPAQAQSAYRPRPLQIYETHPDILQAQMRLLRH